MKQENAFQCIVVGGGHAGIEAALICARMGCATAMVNFSKETIGQMSCNPAIGGVGKGQLVKEVDVLGGEMALAADRTGIQFRQLNSSKGQAVRSSRCQSDRKRYREYMRDTVCAQENLTVIEDEAVKILVKAGKVVGLLTAQGHELKGQALIITAGTFLDGRIHVGPKITSAGRIGEPASTRLTQSLRDLGFEVRFFKTGTPPRIDGRTVDFSMMEEQHSDNPPQPFSFRTSSILKEQRLKPCYITRTTEQTHDIIQQNMHLSPMYSGQISATGVRYCPSIEDKLKKFPDRSNHHVFMEPEGLDTELYYPNGISTGLPENVQEDFVHSIPGLEKAKITQYGYSIEHGMVPPTELTAALMTKKVKGLFLAGQVNGTTGYEEAAAQGLIAGINAVLCVRRRKPFVLGRDESYIGVLIDDLVTKGTDEPYRMFTSRVEYRLVVREDNADNRLSRYAHKLGIISDEDYECVQNKYRLIAQEIRHLKETRVAPGTELDDVLKKENSAPLRQTTSLYQILKRPRVRYHMISPFNGELKDQPQALIDQVEYEIKYEGFIKRQKQDIKRFKHVEAIRIPAGIDYSSVHGLSFEIRQKLVRLSPRTLGQAHRIPGVTPAAVSILMVFLKKLSDERSREKKSSEKDGVKE